jgi:hypothetical protein
MCTLDCLLILESIQGDERGCEKSQEPGELCPLYNRNHTLTPKQAKFLNGLHKRAPGAMKALERYRREVAFEKCGQLSRNLVAFKKLIDAKKIPKSVTSFRYERLGNMITMPV